MAKQLSTCKKVIGVHSPIFYKNDNTPPTTQKMLDCTLCPMCYNLRPDRTALLTARREAFLANDNFGGYMPMICPVGENLIFKTITEEPTESPNIVKSTIQKEKADGSIQIIKTIGWTDALKEQRIKFKDMMTRGIGR